MRRSQRRDRQVWTSQATWPDAESFPAAPVVEPGDAPSPDDDFAVSEVLLESAEEEVEESLFDLAPEADFELERLSVL